MHLLELEPAWIGVGYSEDLRQYTFFNHIDSKHPGSILGISWIRTWWNILRRWSNQAVGIWKGTLEINGAGRGAREDIWLTWSLALHHEIYTEGTKLAWDVIPGSWTVDIQKYPA